MGHCHLFWQFAWLEIKGWSSLVVRHVVTRAIGSRVNMLPGMLVCLICHEQSVWVAQPYALKTGGVVKCFSLPSESQQMMPPKFWRPWGWRAREQSSGTGLVPGCSTAGERLSPWSSSKEKQSWKKAFQSASSCVSGKRDRHGLKMCFAVIAMDFSTQNHCWHWIPCMPTCWHLWNSMREHWDHHRWPNKVCNVGVSHSFKCHVCEKWESWMTDGKHQYTKGRQRKRTSYTQVAAWAH